MSTDPWEGRPVAPEPAVDHSQCNFAWKQVKCDRCDAEYVCTPSSDFYCAAEGDHCCEPCLLGGRGITTVVVAR
jgi:hypothetical protein